MKEFNMYCLNSVTYTGSLVVVITGVLIPFRRGAGWRLAFDMP